MLRLYDKFLAEFLGTFALVFCGTGAIIVNEQFSGVITHPGIAITFGAIVAAMIFTFGSISGAHFNPAVTIAFSLAGLFPYRNIFPYIGSQLCGAFAATLLLHYLFPANQSLGATFPSGSLMQSFILEVILTFILMIVIFNVSHGSKESGVMAGIAIGLTVMLEAMFAGPVSGASMNPARSISPAIISGQINELWIYILAPLVGAILATITWKVSAFLKIR